MSINPFKIALLPGDGIGPEVVEQGVKVLEAMAKHLQLPLALSYHDVGGVAVDRHGMPLPQATLEAAKASHAVLLGAVGGPQYDTLEPSIRPEQGLLQIRKALGLFANLRPVKAYQTLMHTSTLKPEILQGVDMMVVRELTGGLYFGQPKHRDANSAVDTMTYHREEIARIARTAFELAKTRRKKVCSVDKANVLATSQLWRDIVTEIAQGYPGIELTHLYVDNAAMQLILNPAQFDVMLTENTFGDILSDEASMLVGSLGMLPSASLGTSGIGLYEPCHGSAPTLAGKNQANPIATILSVRMMLGITAGYAHEAQAIDRAVETVLAQGYRTGDIAQPGNQVIGTTEMGDRIVEALTASF
jgi:3-isopropylmalate dehydrogenase